MTKNKSFKAIVKFTKIGNRIKFELPFKMYCHDMNIEIPHSQTLDKTDLLYSVWLGDVDKSFKHSDVIYKKVNLIQIYNNCDKPIPVN